MIIKKINIVGFGKLSDFSLDFTSGSNVVYGKNEDGKTTIMAFIKMMFYGTTSKQSESYKVSYALAAYDGFTDIKSAVSELCKNA